MSYILLIFVSFIARLNSPIREHGKYSDAALVPRQLVDGRKGSVRAPVPSRKIRQEEGRETSTTTEL